MIVVDLNMDSSSIALDIIIFVTALVALMKFVEEDVTKLLFKMLDNLLFIYIMVLNRFFYLTK